MSKDNIITRQRRSENWLLFNESLVKIGGIIFILAGYLTARLAVKSELSFTSWSLYISIIYIGLLFFASRSSKRCRAYSDAAEIMLQFDNEEARHKYYDEKLRPQFQ
jgi:cbb3-type cytochrome oxidase subunit 3